MLTWYVFIIQARVAEEQPTSPRDGTAVLTKQVSEKRLQITRPPPPVPKKDGDDKSSSEADPHGAAATGGAPAAEKAPPVVPPKPPRKNLQSTPPLSLGDALDPEKQSGVVSPRAVSMQPQKQPPVLSGADASGSTSPRGTSKPLPPLPNQPKTPTVQETKPSPVPPEKPSAEPPKADQGAKPAQPPVNNRSTPAPMIKEPAAAPPEPKEPPKADASPKTPAAAPKKSPLANSGEVLPVGAVKSPVGAPAKAGAGAPAKAPPKAPTTPHTPTTTPSTSTEANSAPAASPEPNGTDTALKPPASGMKRPPSGSMSVANRPLPKTPAAAAKNPNFNTMPVNRSHSPSVSANFKPGEGRSSPLANRPLPTAPATDSKEPQKAPAKQPPAKGPPPVPAPPPGTGPNPPQASPAPTPSPTPAPTPTVTEPARSLPTPVSNATTTPTPAASTPPPPTGTLSGGISAVGAARKLSHTQGKRTLPKVVSAAPALGNSISPASPTSTPAAGPPKLSASSNGTPAGSAKASPSQTPKSASSPVSGSPDSSPGVTPSPSSDSLASSGNVPAGETKADTKSDEPAAGAKSPRVSGEVTNSAHTDRGTSSTRESGELTLADLTSPPASPRALHEEKEEDDSNFVYRTNIVRELHKTEQFYVKGLTNMLKVFVLPLKELALRGNAQEQLISVDDLKAIFSNIDVLLNVNKKFLEDLTAALETWSPTAKVAHVLLKMIPFLKVYSQYINNYNAAMQRYENCMKNKKFKKFVDDVMTSLAIMDLNDLPSYLIMPIQRIPRYQLLVQELIKKTPQDHPDHADLLAALTKIVHLADEINSAKRDAELISKCGDIQKTLIFPEYSKRKHGIVTTMRRYIRDAKMAEVFENGEKSAYNHVFLFNDCVIVTKPKKKGFLFHLFFYIRRITFTEEADPEGDANKAALKIVSDPKKVNLIFVFANAEERGQWFKDLQKGMEHVEQRNMTSDDEDDAHYHIEREKAKTEKKEKSAKRKELSEKKDKDVATNRRRFKTLDFKKRKDIESGSKFTPVGAVDDVFDPEKVKDLAQELNRIVHAKTQQTQSSQPKSNS